MAKGNRKNGQPKTSRRNVEARRKQGLAVELRLKGWSLNQIARKVGYASASGVIKAVEAGMKTLCPPEKAEALREREVVKCDVIEREAWRQWKKSTEDGVKCTTKESAVDPTGSKEASAAMVDAVEIERSTTVEGQSGNPALLDKVLKAMERRAKLLGLDSPVKHDVKHGALDVFDPAALQRIREAINPETNATELPHTSD